MELHVNYMLMLTFNLNKQSKGFWLVAENFRQLYSLHIKKLQRDMHMSAMLLYILFCNIC